LGRSLNTVRPEDLSRKLDSWTSHTELKNWIKKSVELCQPDNVVLCDGSKAEADELSAQMVKSGAFVKLNPRIRPDSYLARSDPRDVARVEDRTFISSKMEDDSGPTNNWVAPDKMKAELDRRFSGSMKGRSMYVIPYCMGPLGSYISHNGVELTDSPYVVANMRIMTRMGKAVVEQLGSNKPFVPCTHSVGMPLTGGKKDVAWPCNPEHKYIVHFPESHAIYSYGSGYGGNALLGKKCFALRIASVLAKEQGWLAEHMLILGLTNPQGKKIYVAAAFPSMCGKTNLAMLQSSLPGWKVETVGDDIAWMKFGQDGRLYAINPESGFFGVAPGTGMDSNPNAIKVVRSNTIFTNCALTESGDVWWEGMTKQPPSEKMETWDRRPYQKGVKGLLAAHKNGRFTAPLSQCPCIDEAWEDPRGVPISAILFGGRRESLVPLVYQSFDWEHGTFLGTAVSSEETAAAQGNIGAVRHDPFAMLPFCGYNMADYFQHWLEIGRKAPNKALLPKIFNVNWFRKDKDDKWMWPGYGDNLRVLKWMFERVTSNNDSNAIRTPIGWVPRADAIDISGMPTKPPMKELLAIDKKGWIKEADGLAQYYHTKFGSRLPSGIRSQLEGLQSRLMSDI